MKPNPEAPAQTVVEPLGRDEMIGKRYTLLKAEQRAKLAALESTKPKPKFSLKQKDARPFTPLSKPANEWLSTYKTYMPVNQSDAPAAALAATQAARYQKLASTQPERWNRNGDMTENVKESEPVGGSSGSGSGGQSAAAAGSGGAGGAVAPPAAAVGYTSNAYHIHRAEMNVNSLAYQNRMADANFMRVKTQPTGYAMDYGSYGAHPMDRLQTGSDGKIAYTASASTADLFAGTVKGSLGRHIPGYTGHVPGSRVNTRLLGGGAGLPPKGVHATESHKTKNNLAENYRHNMPGYSGYHPTTLSNDRGPRNPTSRVPPPTGCNTGLMLASMKSSA